jgi:hypothetical protein
MSRRQIVMVCALAGSVGDEPMPNPDAGGNRFGLSKAILAVWRREQ